MKRFRDIYPLFAVMMLIFLCACTKEESVMQQTEGPEFVIGTKASENVGSPTTFQIMAYGAQEENHFNCVSSGAYIIEDVDFNGFAYLSSTQPLVIPLDEVGNDFYVSYVSPAMDHADGCFKVENFDNPFYCSDVQKVQLFNYGKVDITEDLVDRRAKIGFRIYKDNEDKTVSIEDFKIIGAGKTYWPATQQVTASDEELPIKLNAPASSAESLLVYEYLDDDMEFVLSGIYSPKEVVADSILNNTDYGIGFNPTNLQESDYLYVSFNLSINDGGYNLLTAPLTTETLKGLNPLTTYVYNITVSNTYIKTILEITKWDSWEEIEFGYEIKDDTQIIDLGTIQIGGWEDGKWDDQQIRK